MKRTLLAVAILTLTLQSCKKDNWPCLNGKGSTTSEERTVSDFTRIDQQMDANVYVSQGADYYVKVEAQSNLLDDIKTEVSGTTLRIYTKRCIRKHDPIKIYVTLPTVEGITLSGSGSVTTMSRIESNTFEANVNGSGTWMSGDSIVANTLTTDISGSGNVSLFGSFNTMSTNISGSGNVTLNGVGTTHGITISGSGDVHAYGLQVQLCTVNISGSSNAEVNVSNSLDVTISGSGDVYYKGSPAVSTHTSGSGDVVHKP